MNRKKMNKIDMLVSKLEELVKTVTWRKAFVRNRKGRVEFVRGHFVRFSARLRKKTLSAQTKSGLVLANLLSSPNNTWDANKLQFDLTFSRGKGGTLLFGEVETSISLDDLKNSPMGEHWDWNRITLDKVLRSTYKKLKRELYEKRQREEGVSHYITVSPALTKGKQGIHIRIIMDANEQLPSPDEIKLDKLPSLNDIIVEFNRYFGRKQTLGFDLPTILETRVLPKIFEAFHNKDYEAIGKMLDTYIRNIRNDKYGGKKNLSNLSQNKLLEISLQKEKAMVVGTAYILARLRNYIEMNPHLWRNNQKKKMRLLTELGNKLVQGFIERFSPQNREIARGYLNEIWGHIVNLPIDYHYTHIIHESKHHDVSLYPQKPAENYVKMKRKRPKTKKTKIRS